MKTEIVDTKQEVLFNNPVEKFNLTMLRNSANEQLARGGMPSNRPVMHHELITYISQLYEDTVGAVQMSPIYVSARHAKRINFKGTAKDACPVSNILVERAVVQLSAPKMEKELELGEWINGRIDKTKIEPTIGISYNDKGISIAIGTNVFVCSNMCVLGGTSYSTYGPRKMSFENLKDLVKEKILKTKEKFEEDIKLIQKLSEFSLAKSEQKLLCSDFLEHSIKNNNNRKATILNITQSVAMTREVMTKREEKDGSDDLTGWDMFQAGTQNIKPDNTDMVIIHETLEKFGEQMMQKLSIA